MHEKSLPRAEACLGPILRANMRQLCQFCLTKGLRISAISSEPTIMILAEPIVVKCNGEEEIRFYRKIEGRACCKLEVLPDVLKEWRVENNGNSNYSRYFGSTSHQHWHFSLHHLSARHA